MTSMGKPSAASAWGNAIHRAGPLTLLSGFRFPRQASESRHEVLVGALWLLVPGGGWILNMGHRIAMVRRMQRGLSAWPAWHGYGTLLKDGVYALLGMLEQLGGEAPPPCAVMPPMRAAAIPPMRTFGEPIAMMSGGPTDTTRSPIRGAGIPPNRKGLPAGGRMGPAKAGRGA